MLELDAVDDEEGARVDPGLPFLVDAHVHLFPDGLFDAIWKWFDEYGWPIRYKLRTPKIVSFLLDRGVDHLVALAYAHKPGIARGLNAYMAGIARGEPRVTALATVLPGEPDAGLILEEAFASGLQGVKLHCHVQCFAVDAPEMQVIYETCLRHDKPILVHAGREPKSPGYKCDPHALCSAERMAIVLAAYPHLRIAVPHLGIDEFEEYVALLERYDNLRLDTTMTLAGVLGDDTRAFEIAEAYADRIMYGTDFPNVPYAWDRELRRIVARRLDDVTLASLLGGTARAFYRLAVD
jgi:uncharacterized protein